MSECASTAGLPALLAEYGQLAARLSQAEPVQARQLRARLAELDALIDAWIADLQPRPHL